MAILQPNAIHQSQFCRIAVMTQSIQSNSISRLVSGLPGVDSCPATKCSALHTLILGGSMKQLLILGPKGGVGKTTLARNLAVAAARAGLSVGTMDLDGQGTLDQWCNYRPEHQPPVISYTHSYMALDEKGIRKIPGLDLLVI